MMNLQLNVIWELKPGWRRWVLGAWPGSIFLPPPPLNLSLLFLPALLQQFSSSVPLCHAALPWGQQTTEENLYKPCIWFPLRLSDEKGTKIIFCLFVLSGCFEIIQFSTAGLQLMILLPHLPECWSWRCVLPPVAEFF